MLAPTAMLAQRFFNLTADEVRIGTAPPCFAYTVPLDGAWQDSIYTVSIVYPEFISMSAAEIASYNATGYDAPGAMPELTTRTVFSRKSAALQTEFCPVVVRDGRYMMLVSFMLRIEATPKTAASHVKPMQTAAASERYAASSVLASGSWAKISVPATGIYQITEALAKKAGFSDLSRVKVYGYGGNLLEEVLDGDALAATDDLHEVATCTVDGRRLFFAQGPVSWEANTTAARTRNPYADYGCYFLTDSGDDEPLTVDETTFLASFYPSPYYYHTLHEVDGYAWYQGGRNLFDTQSIALGGSQTVSIGGNTNATRGSLTVNVSAGTATTVQIAFNDSVVGTQKITLSTYDEGSEKSATYAIKGLTTDNTVTITVTAGGPARLDYVSMAWDNALPAPDLGSSSIAEPTYLYNITNQNLHADEPIDMLIIIPASQELATHAQRLADYHATNDGMRVRVVPADELYNEFSSGTPDAGAYRRYLKMQYDRAASDDDMPKYLILFGDCVWDNRMLTADCSTLDADDYLLCFESENSFNEVKCYVDDGFFCMLDDGEGGSPLLSDKLDMAVGRFPVTTADDAKTMVDKAISYMDNEYADDWQNVLVFMGDDGNDNLHMQQSNSAADYIASLYPGYNIEKVMWDAYERETTSTGNFYPDATDVITRRQEAGALIMDYMGHGRADQISHESVLRLSDFAAFTNTNLPLWVTASCDIMPFDGTQSTIGETAVLNAKGGAVAFYGTTRTVYSTHNNTMNRSFLTNVLSINDDGKPMTVGEAQRRAKNNVATNSNNEIVNNLQYSLLGDPAMRLALPTTTVVVDSINGEALATGATPQVKAGSIMTISGHIDGASDFDGTLSATIFDSEELITCLWNDKNDSDGADEAFTYYDRTNTLYSGSNTVTNGSFTIQFAVPKDINYSDEAGQIIVYAVNEQKTLTAHGENTSFTVGGSAANENDSIGPSIYCYLNSPSFTNGGNVNPTPYFVAEITDNDGINAAGSGIGHEMRLVVDGSAAMTYYLNDNFSFDFGSYTSGSTYYNIPELDEGDHVLTFRAWDVLNNMNEAQLKFTVVSGLTPSVSVGCSDNPATDATTFIVNHDRIGSDIDVQIDLFDTSGRHLWRHEDDGVSTSGAYTYEWNLTLASGQKLQTGVYIYRVRTWSDGSKPSSVAKKLVVISNN